MPSKSSESLIYRQICLLHHQQIHQTSLLTPWDPVGPRICECVGSNSNFHPRNQDVDFDMLEMFFSFRCTKYDENRWLITKLFMRHNSPKKTIRLDMSANFLLRVQRILANFGLFWPRLASVFLWGNLYFCGEASATFRDQSARLGEHLSQKLTPAHPYNPFFLAKNVPRRFQKWKTLTLAICLKNFS